MYGTLGARVSLHSRAQVVGVCFVVVAVVAVGVAAVYLQGNAHAFKLLGLKYTALSTLLGSPVALMSTISNSEHHAAAQQLHCNATLRCAAGTQVPIVGSSRMELVKLQ